MDYQEPLIFHGALNLEGPTLTSAVEQYRDYLINF
jgi:hypothetical protein